LSARRAFASASSRNSSAEAINLSSESFIDPGTGTG
jgi:hypothetical protein